MEFEIIDVTEKERSQHSSHDERMFHRLSLGSIKRFQRKEDDRSITIQMQTPRRDAIRLPQPMFRARPVQITAWTENMAGISPNADKALYSEEVVTTFRSKPEWLPEGAKWCSDCHKEFFPMKPHHASCRFCAAEKKR